MSTPIGAEQLTELTAAVPAADPIADLRRKAIDRFGALGYPTTRNEEWRYTQTGALAKVATRPATGAVLDLRAIEAVFGGALPEARLVFASGRFMPELSAIPAIHGLTVQSLEAALASGARGAREVLEAALEDVDHGFAALNLALFASGAFVQVAPGAEVRTPLHLIFVGGGEGTAHVRNVIDAGAGSRLALIETYLGTGAALTNAVTSVCLHDHSELEHARLQDEPPAAFHLGRIEVRHGRSSRFASCVLQLGAAIGRSETIARVRDGGECHLGGLYVAGGERHSDNFVFVDHCGNGGTSRQLYKGVLEDQSTSAFFGKVRVHENTKRNDARQTNKNLLLSEGATANTRPQLEIYSEDVQCSHGATVGRLDEQQVFYLRSRGIGSTEARALLTYAFAADVLDEAAPAMARPHLSRALSRRLGSALHLEAKER